MTLDSQINPVIIPSIVGCVVLVPELLLLLTRFSRSRSAIPADRFSLTYVWGTIITGLVVAIPFAYFHVPQRLFFELGESGLILTFAILLVGILLRWWAIHSLGSFFTVNIAVHQGHRLITAGPYAIIRHPSYTGLFIELFALALTFQHVVSLSLIMIAATIALMKRINIEERVLGNILGAEYRSYHQQTYCLFPYLF
jgi:protein-S-isoprenylcysteine O-methyltransferase Ste14